MSREHPPCGSCARFIGDEGPGHCEGFDRPAHSTDHPCVLFNERGSWKARQVEMPSKAGEKQRQRTAA
jgi:hypothetical protein